MATTLYSPGAGEFEKLKERVRKGVTLPVPSSASMRLLETLGSSDFTTRSLELVISGDPSLATTVLTSAEVPFSMRQDGQISLRDAVMVLGSEALKAIAISVSLQALQAKASVLTKGRFARHSVAVAFTAKYLFARCFLKGGEPRATMTQDEIYAVGLLHDIGFLLFASQDPSAYMKVDFVAKRSDSSVTAAFRNAYEKDLCDLVPALFDRWVHMAKLTKAIVSLGRPWEFPEEQDALRCILAADYLVTVSMNMPTENRVIKEQPRPEIASLCDEALGELEILQTAIQAHFQKCGVEELG